MSKTYIPALARRILDPENRAMLAVASLMFVLLVLLIIASLGSSEPKPDKIPIQTKDDPVIAMVNTKPIKASQLQSAQQILRNKLTDEEISNGISLSEKDALDYLVQLSLLSEKAEAENLHQDPEVAARLVFLRQEYLAEKLVEQEVFNTVTDAEIENYYNLELAQNPPRLQRKARQIVLPDEATAREIVRRLDEGESFASLAIAYSIDRLSRELAGEMGYIDRDMPNETLSDKLFSGPMGERLAPFKSEEGWHIVEIQSERMSPIPSLESRREAIRALLQTRNIDGLLSGLRQKADIQILEPSFELSEPSTPSDP